MNARAGAALADKVELVGYNDLEGRAGFKLAMHEVDDRWYLYVANMWHPGWFVLDVTDPSAPDLLASLTGPENTSTSQVQVADGKLITSLAPKLPGWGLDPDGAKPEEGFYVWDLAEPSAPERVGHWRSGADGTHRNFYAGGDLVHASAGFSDMSGHIYAAVDISSPDRPTTVGRWWWPGQDQGEHLSQTEVITEAETGRLGSKDRPVAVSHHGGAYVQDGLAYCPWMGAGMAILDVGDPSDPRLVSTFEVHPPLGSWLAVHSCVPLPGTKYVVVNSEAVAEKGADGNNYIAIVDVEDPASPWLVSIFPTPRAPSGYPSPSFVEHGGRFGPHNQHQPQHQDCLLHSSEFIFTTYFNAGLQVFDIRDPWSPQIAGYYIPDDPVERRGPHPHDLVTQCEDVLVDRRGFIYVTDKNSGVRVLRFASV